MKARGNGPPAFILQTYEDRLNNNNNNKELTQKLNERLSNLQNGTNEETKRLTINKISSADSTPPPPPPPPLKNGSLDSSTISTPASSTPSTRSNTLKSTKPKAPPVPVKYSVLSYNQSPTDCAKTSSFPLTNGYNSSSSSSPHNNHHHQPPPCPSPDYDTLSLTSTTSRSSHTMEGMHQVKPGGHGGDTAEMESLESFKINNPADVKHRPPSTYFQKRLLTSSVSNQSSNSTSNTSTIRRSRPVSVTIGEYPSMRRQPGKLDFLQNGVHGGPGGRNGDDLGSRLTSELTQTLNRSNLKKRTESMENLLGDSKSPSQIKTQRNGAVRISLSNLSKAFAKSTSDLTEDCRTRYDTLPNRPTNRVTINVNLAANKQHSDSGGTTPPSGILKNGGTTAAEGHKVLAAQKSITFGEMPTLIKDKSPVKP